MRRGSSFWPTYFGAKKKDCLLKGLDIERLKYFPTLTREKFVNEGRITDLIASGCLFS